jgi:type IV pilus assembly protein PilN
MAKINLRPWREERDERLQKKFVANLVASGLLGVLLLLVSAQYYDLQIGRQEDRNAYLKSEIAILDQKIQEIRELRAKRERLLERLNVIQQLQGNRPVIVRSFDELVRVLPDDVHYTSLSRAGEVINIKGVAKSNGDISALMRSLNQSIWFKEPDLKKVDNQDGSMRFDMNVAMTRPDAEEASR